MPLIKQNNYFVSCKDNPQTPLKHWFPGMSGIYHECVCGKTCSFSSGHHEDYHTHLDVYRVYLRMVGNWDAYLDAALATCEHNRKQYLITWDDVTYGK